MIKGNWVVEQTKLMITLNYTFNQKRFCCSLFSFYVLTVNYVDYISLSPNPLTFVNYINLFYHCVDGHMYEDCSYSYKCTAKDFHTSHTICIETPLHWFFILSSQCSYLHSTRQGLYTLSVWRRTCSLFSVCRRTLLYYYLPTPVSVCIDIYLGNFDYGLRCCLVTRSTFLRLDPNTRKKYSFLLLHLLLTYFIVFV